MAIINTNIIELKDSGLNLDQTVIIGHDFTGKASIGKAGILMQTNFYLNVEKWQQGVTNYLSVVGYDTKVQKQVSFDYPQGTVEDIFYFFDLKLKAHLMQIFPDWDEAKLVITTVPEIIE